MKRRFLFLLAVCVLLAGSFTTTAYGAEASVTLKSVEQIQEGDSFAAGLVYEGEDLVSATVEVTYDEEILEYRSCSGGEGFAEDGIVRISLYDVEGTDTFTCKIRFQGIAEGESFVTVTTAALRDVDGADVTAETRSVKVTVTEDLPPAADSVDDKTADDPVNEPAGVKPEAESSLKDRILSKAAEYADRIRAWLGGLSQEEFLLVCMGVTAAVLAAVAAAGTRK